MYRALTSNGHPLRPRSFFIGIRRDAIANLNFEQAAATGGNITIPVRFLGELKNLEGFVAQVNIFPTGKLVCLRPRPGGFLGNWDNVDIWINVNGPLGVLS